MGRTPPSRLGYQRGHHRCYPGRPGSDVFDEVKEAGQGIEGEIRKELDLPGEEPVIGGARAWAKGTRSFPEVDPVRGERSSWSRSTLRF